VGTIEDKACESFCEDLRKDYGEETKKWDNNIGKSVWFYARKIDNGTIVLREKTGREVAF